MKFSLFYLPFLLASLTAQPAQALDDNATIRKKLQEWGMQKIEIEDLPIKGLKRIITSEKGIFYVSADSKYLLQGELYDISGPNPINISNMPLLKILAELEKEMIIYKAAQEKYAITIFTDITCSYCLALHEKINDYQALGITVRYLAFPRGGIKSKSGTDMQAIWCANNKKSAFEAALKKNNVTVSPKITSTSKAKKCSVNIAKHYEVAIQLGIQGTPAIVLPNGNIMPGYQEPETLAKLLENQKNAAENGKGNKQ